MARAAAVVILSDLGECGGSDAMIGAVKKVDPALDVYALIDQIPRFDVAKAGAVLSDQLLSWPRGVVFVCAVDPPTGSDRRVALALTEDGYAIVAPDNGCLDAARREHGFKELRDLTGRDAACGAAEASEPRHGRNLAHLAALLASGREAPADMGPLRGAGGGDDPAGGARS